MESKQTKRKSQDLILSDEQLAKKLKDGQNSNTVKSELKADRAFTRFLKENGAEQFEYWFFEEPELDTWLAKFWLCVRKKDDSDSDTEDPERKDQMYSANTLRSFRYGLNRILKSKGHLYKITEKGTSFMKSDEAFNLAIKELKSEGKAEVHSYPEITEEGTVPRSIVYHMVCHWQKRKIFCVGFRAQKLLNFCTCVANIKLN